MKKKFLALVLTLAMVLSLVPVTALATDGAPTPDVVDGYYNNDNQWVQGEQARSDELQDTVTTVNKKAEKVAGQDNQYEVTLTVQMKHKTEEVQPGAAATVLVIDTSGSMDYCTDPTHTHKKDKYGNRCGTWNGRTSRLSVAKTAAINFLKSYSGFSASNFDQSGKLKKNVNGKNLNRYVSLVTFNDSASVKQNWIDVSTKTGYDRLFKSINKIEASDGTNLDDALRLAKTQMQSGSIAQIDQSKRNVIALTDGVPTYYVSIGTGWFGKDENVSQHGNYGCPDTNVATTRSADALKADGTAVYTVCFGAANDICWTKDSVHVEHTFKDDEKHTTDGPRVGKFLEEKIATSSTSEKKYAYNADDAEGLYQAFAAITQTITDGLNEGVVTDGLPNGVMAVEGSGFVERWELKSNEATVTKDGEYNVYTYTKTYRVNVDPATVKTVKVGEVNYAPLNTPTILTVQHNGSPDQIPFPIPAGKVTYSLTDFDKALVTKADNFSNPPEGVTIPNDADSTVTVGENGVTLLYKITVSGGKGAKFTVTDAGATLVPPTDDSITENTASSTFSGAVGDTGKTVFYVSKHFTERDIDSSSDTKTVSNTATIDPGDNTNGPEEKEKTKTVTTKVEKEKSQTYTVTYQWAEGETPSDANTLLPQGGTFTVGTEYTVVNAPGSNVKKNEAGDSGKWTCTWDKRGDVGSTATAGDNIVITGTWKFTKDPPKTGNLIVKKVVSGDGVTLNDLPENFTITVSAGEGQEPIDLTLTGTNYTATKDEANTTATWTIPNLTPGTYTVSEEKADVTGYDCTATYASSNETDIEKSVTVTENGGTMTVTNKYTKQQEVVPTPDTSKPDVNKIATALANDKTDVTLSVGGKSAKENVAVMFLLDKSTSMGTRTEAAKMLQHLKGLTNTNIIYDVVIFSGTASSTGWKNISDDAAYTDTQENFNNKEPSPGTNMPVGIDKAIQDMETLRF